jgi:hypothetical protein
MAPPLRYLPKKTTGDDAEDGSRRWMTYFRSAILSSPPRTFGPHANGFVITKRLQIAGRDFSCAALA